MSRSGVLLPVRERGFSEAGATRRSKFIAAALACFLFTGAQTSAEEITQQQWRNDIDYLAAQAPKVHSNLFHAMTPEQWQAALDAAKSTMVHSREDEIVAVMRLTALIQDAHNEIEFPCGEGGDTNYPLRLAWFPQGIVVEAAPPQYASIVGGTLEAIDDTPIDRVWSEFLPLVSHDAGNVEGGLQVHPTIYLTCSGMLHALGITRAANGATYAVSQNGAHVRATLRTAASWLSVVRPLTVVPTDNWIEAGPTSAPLWLSHPRTMFWYEYLQQSRALYVQINNVLDARNETFARFASQLIGAITRDKPRKLILDLRRNTGGDNTLLRPLLVGLIQARSINRLGGLFVLTSHATFSAAQNLCNRLQNYTNAIYIGQPTADNVNFYADAKPIVLPNSRIEIHLAHLYWQDGDPRDRRAALYPDIAVDPSLEDFLRGRDRTLDAALEYKPEPTLEDRLHTTSEFGFERAYAEYQAFVEDPRHKYLYGLEGRLNALGYELLSEKAYARAVTIFRINTVANPNSSNAWDSLGDGYLAQGLKADASAAYRHALELDPGNADALRSLRQLVP